MKRQGQKAKNASAGSVAWVYDEEHGWINVSLFLKKIEKLEKELYSRFQEMGYIT
jgi:hypothetical protein